VCERERARERKRESAREREGEGREKQGGRETHRIHIRVYPRMPSMAGLSAKEPSIIALICGK